MIRAPRPRRPALVLVVLAALLAFPIGVLAAHQFADVPNSNIFHGDIDALVDAGITAGCGGSNYCPNQAVTRGQMAAFMNRLGALAPGKVPVVNADRVDGYHANGLTRMAYGTSAATTAIPDFPTEVSYGAVTISAPAAGFVVVTAAVTIQNSCATGVCDSFGRVRHVESGNVGQWMIVEPLGSTFDAFSFAAVFPVDAGDNTFDVRLSRDSGGDGTQSGFYAQLTATFSPFGSSGGSTLAIPTIDPAAPPTQSR